MNKHFYGTAFVSCRATKLEAERYELTKSAKARRSVYSAGKRGFAGIRSVHERPPGAARPQRSEM
ncbi:hypothetical protein [Paenibacillus humicola]|uniref:hypothetical protein n=1 Tax=Paenibacillus humicola TaxID=3110540 RepID=UPI00237ACB14|nr:hypothetical protein [Paenibacillus humicola]